MDASLQSKLLTFLDTQSFVRVGGEESISISTRIFACSNMDLDVLVQQGRFRPDLFYRLNVLPIRLPALRERQADVPILVQQIMERLAAEMGLTTCPTIEPQAMEMLRSHTWPGNIRELRNALERALMLCIGGCVRPTDFTIAPRAGEWRLNVAFPSGRSLHQITRDVARSVVCEALRRSRTKQEAADLLGLSRHALAHQMRALGIDTEPT